MSKDPFDKASEEFIKDLDATVTGFNKRMREREATFRGIIRGLQTKRDPKGGIERNIEIDFYDMTGGNKK